MFSFVLRVQKEYKLSPLAENIEHDRIKMYKRRGGDDVGVPLVVILELISSRPIRVIVYECWSEK